MDNLGMALTAAAGPRLLVVAAEPQQRQRLEQALGSAAAELISRDQAGAALHVLMHEHIDAVVVGSLADFQPTVFLAEVARVWPWVGRVLVTATGAGVVDALVVAPADQEARLMPAVLQSWRANREQARGSVLSLADVHQQFRTLRQLTEQGLRADSNLEALRCLSMGLAELLPCSLAGLLTCADGHVHAFLQLRKPVHPEFVAASRAAMLARFTDFGGQKVSADKLTLEVGGAKVNAAGTMDICSIATVPIFLDEQVQGVLCLADAGTATYSAAEHLLLYHAADHTSMVFAGLSRMRRLAIMDPLTGLYIRLYVEEALTQAVEREHRLGTPVDVVIVDLDHFKTVNDTYGHAVGDQVLKEFAQLLRGTARKTDIVGRYGGEEFIVVLASQGLQSAVAFGARLLSLVRDHSFCAQSHLLRVTASLGIASSLDCADHAAGSEQLLARADQALYLSKRRGRNQMRVWANDVKPGQNALRPPDQSQGLILPRGHVLVVDDDAAVRDILRRILEAGSFSVAETDNCQDAIKMVAAAPEDYDVILSDICMPGRSGLELLKDLRRFDNTLVVIMMTGDTNVQFALQSLRHGAHEFIEKPIVAEHLLAVVRRAVEYRSAIKENCRYQVYLEELVRQKSQDLSRSYEEIKQSYNFSLEALVALLDARECESARHSLRVRELCMILGRQMGLQDHELQDLGRGALLHDIGKIAVPDAVLQKPGPLNNHEMTVMRRHPQTGYRILGDSAWLANAAELVYSHHERFDGSGYPRGLQGTQICLGARVFAVVDAYDAMRRNRVYRAALSRRTATAELLDNAGSQFDPSVVEAFLSIQDAVENYLATAE